MAYSDLRSSFKDGKFLFFGGSAKQMQAEEPLNVNNNCERSIFVKHEDDAFVVEPLCLVLMRLFMIEWGSEGVIIRQEQPSFNLGLGHREFIDKVPEYRSPMFSL